MDEYQLLGKKGFGDALFFQKIPILISSIYEDVDRIVAREGEIGGNMSGVKDG